MTQRKPPDDSELQALYRAAAQAAGDEPDAQLDARILAAARVASGERQASRQRPPAAWWKRWLIPVSVTAVAVLGISLTLRVNDEQAVLKAARQMAEAPPADRNEAVPPRLAEPESTAIGAAQRADRRAEKPTGQSPLESRGAAAKALPEAATARPEPAAPAPAAATTTRPEPAPLPVSPPSLLRAKPATEAPPPPAAPRDLPAELGATYEEKARRELTPSAPAPATFGQGRSPTLDDRASQAAKAAAELRESSARRSRAPESDQSLGTGAAASGVSPARQNEDTAALEASPERWLEKIRDLRRTKRMAEAKQELDRFRQRYPDFALPADLK